MLHGKLDAVKHPATLESSLAEPDGRRLHPWCPRPRPRSGPAGRPRPGSTTWCWCRRRRPIPRIAPALGAARRQGGRHRGAARRHRPVAEPQRRARAGPRRGHARRRRRRDPSARRLRRHPGVLRRPPGDRTPRRPVLRPGRCGRASASRPGSGGSARWNAGGISSHELALRTAPVRASACASMRVSAPGPGHRPSSARSIVFVSDCLARRPRRHLRAAARQPCTLRRARASSGKARPRPGPGPRSSPGCSGAPALPMRLAFALKNHRRFTSGRDLRAFLRG